MHDGRVDHHVVVDELRRPGRVGQDPADRSGHEEHVLPDGLRGTSSSPPPGRGDRVDGESRSKGCRSRPPAAVAGLPNQPNRRGRQRKFGGDTEVSLAQDTGRLVRRGCVPHPRSFLRCGRHAPNDFQSLSGRLFPTEPAAERHPASRHDDCCPGCTHISSIPSASSSTDRGSTRRAALPTDSAIGDTFEVRTECRRPWPPARQSEALVRDG